MSHNGERQDSQGKRHKGGLRVKTLLHMSGSDKHNRESELHFRHEQEQDPGGLECTQIEYDIQELDDPTEDRQVVRHDIGAQYRRAKTVEYDGSSEDSKGKAAGVRQIKRGNTERMADH
eukprot:6675986-Heterocapsa_arctica.AAC.1